MIEDLNNRLKKLDAVITHQFVEVQIDDETFVKCNDQIFTPGEIICINQERGAIRDQINFINGTIPLKEVREYKVSEIIESKIKQIIK